jgi:M6 family metalloprotease-like protein
MQVDGDRKYPDHMTSKMRGFLVVICLALFATTVTNARASEGPKDLQCPTMAGKNPPESFQNINIKSLNFQGQYLQRVEPNNGEVIQNPTGILGCYKFFSANTGYDAGWDVGIIDYIGGKYKWINYRGATWDLIPDFENNRFITNTTNPYYPEIFYIESVFKPISGDSSTCKQFRVRDIGFPIQKNSVNESADPLFLAVAIDFKERFAKSAEEELARFDFSNVENFWNKNSYSKSRLKIEKFSRLIYLDEPVSNFEGGKEWALLPKVIAELVKTIDLDKYSGFIFATSAAGPKLNGGYARRVNVPSLKPLTWMGGFNPVIENHVPAWKVVAHEIGHNYALPDLYKYNNENSAGKTLGPFDLMDAITGISNSLTFYHRWMLGWLNDDEVACLIPNEVPKSYEITPISTVGNGLKGISIPLSAYESILIEARVLSEFDSLTTDQEGILVYRVDTRVSTGNGPLVIIPSNNEWTKNTKILDDVERFKFGTLRKSERVSHDEIFVEFTSRDKDLFKVTITKGNEYFSEVDRKAAADKAAADAKAAADKAATIKKKTITCIKGKTTKKVTAVKPKCPAGYKKK